MRTLLHHADSILRVLSDNAVAANRAMAWVRSYAPSIASGVRRVSVARYAVAEELPAAFAGGLIAGAARRVEYSFRFAAFCTFGLANFASRGGRPGHPDHHRQVGNAA